MAFTVSAGIQCPLCDWQGLVDVRHEGNEEVAYRCATCLTEFDAEMEPYFDDEGE